MTEPLAEINDGVCWIFEGEDADVECRHEGTIEVYPNWVRLGDGVGIPNWVPRERVEQVHER